MFVYYYICFSFLSTFFSHSTRVRFTVGIGISDFFFVFFFIHSFILPSFHHRHLFLLPIKFDATTRTIFSGVRNDMWCCNLTRANQSVKWMLFRCSCLPFHFECSVEFCDAPGTKRMHYIKMSQKYFRYFLICHQFSFRRVFKSSCPILYSIYSIRILHTKFKFFRITNHEQLSIE